MAGEGPVGGVDEMRSDTCAPHLPSEGAYMLILFFRKNVPRKIAPTKQRYLLELERQRLLLAALCFWR